MSIFYYKLFDLMGRNNIKKGKLCELADISKTTMAKLSSHQDVRMDVINKICKALNCQPGDILEYIEDEKAPECELLPVK